jgi:hypothetical protein
MYNVDSASPENKSFVNKFRTQYRRLDTWAAQCYDALHILAKAVKFTVSRNPLDLSYSIPKSKRYLCWRRRRLPRRMYNTPRRLLLAASISSLI